MTMTMIEALRRAADALRADAAAAAPGEIGEDARSRAADLAAAAIVDRCIWAEEAETLAARHALDRLAECGGGGGPLAEDLVAAGRGMPRHVAEVIEEAVGGERLRIAAAACSILAEAIRGGQFGLTTERLAEIERATRADWIEP